MAQCGLEEFVPKQHKAKMKRVLKEEWFRECAYCGYKERNKEMTVDHIIPLAKGGSDSFYNQIPACRSCNVSKGDKPVRQWYFDHEEYSTERWLKIKQHMSKEQPEIFAA